MSKILNASLELVTPQGGRMVVPLSERPLTLGRSPDCDIVIEEPFVSSCHACIEPVGEEYVLKDAGSTNGTWVDGQPVEQGRPLSNGSRLILGREGNYQLKFIEEAGDTPDSENRGLGGEPIHASPRAGADSMGRINQNLTEVLEISKALLFTHNLEEVLGRVLEACLRISQAERGFLFLSEGTDLKLRASSDGEQDRTTEEQIEFSHSIAQRVAETGTAEYLSDLDNDSGKGVSASIMRLRLRTVTCVPLKIQERVIGIVYLDSHLPTVRPDATGREVLEVLAGLAAVAIENAQMIQERVENERWSAIGRMAASIVHDIRNPLTALRGTAEMLARKVAEPHHKEKLKLMMGEVDRLTQLSSQMLEFSSKAQPLNPSRVPLSELICNFLSAVEPQLEKEQIRLAANLGYKGCLDLDKQKMFRLLHNVVGNALQAMEPGGTLTFESKERREANGANRQVLLAIADTGCGMDEQTLQKVFEPFFSQGKDRGIGLGMSIVRRIAEQHGASVAVRSLPGSGTRVEFAFPVPNGDSSVENRSA